MLHGNVCPNSIVISRRGMWKLGGFGFAEKAREGRVSVFFAISLIFPNFNHSDVTSRKKKHSVVIYPVPQYLVHFFFYRWENGRNIDISIDLTALWLWFWFPDSHGSSHRLLFNWVEIYDVFQFKYICFLNNIWLRNGHMSFKSTLVKRRGYATKVRGFCIAALLVHSSLALPCNVIWKIVHIVMFHYSFRPLHFH